ncbi:TPA_asm: hypothetical protein [Powellomyces chytrid fungus MELD virus 4]|nr:TPA_asm: hypothetical protein [Powellomyces chytrid fungus MELD virus 4]
MNDILKTVYKYADIDTRMKMQKIAPSLKYERMSDERRLVVSNATKLLLCKIPQAVVKKLYIDVAWISFGNGRSLEKYLDTGMFHITPSYHLKDMVQQEPMMNSSVLERLIQTKTFGLRALNVYNKVNLGIRSGIKHIDTARDVYEKIEKTIASDESVPIKLRSYALRGRQYVDEVHSGLGRGYNIQQNFDKALRDSLAINLR